ncbi:MAG: transporter [Proteobacteria bacterium]|nr:transporter [Pseudomonadota bacterium]
MPVSILIMLLTILTFSGTAFAGRPLITDDTSTQGTGKYLLELSGEYSHDDDEGVTVNKKSITVELDYGIKDNIDLTVSSGYQNFQIDNLGNTSSPEGITDTLIELKWRFYEDKNGLSLAIKPGIFIPTGDYTKGFGGGDVRLGTGEVRYRLYFIGTKEFKHAAFHLNLGYLRNEAMYDARENLLHASFAGEWKITKKFKIVGNIGVDTSPDTDSCIDPVFLLGGFVYSLSDRIDLNLGVKRNLNDPGYDLTFTGGISIKF